MTENDRENGSSGKRLRNEFRVFFSIFRAYSVKKYPPVRKAPGGMVILYRLLYLSLGILVVFC